MRGKGCGFSGFFDLLGITPAYAGKRAAAAPAAAGHQDHPRVCGEKLKSCSITATRQGSPPRMRGKELLPRCSWCCIGITPAYAGKSGSSRSPSASRRDHPRVCGEKRPCVPPSPPLLGSPPRMRGKGRHNLILQDLTRITPAYAGKRASPQNVAYYLRDHPRVCGEKTKKIP